VTPSELAFLALGFILGIATGGALIVVFATRPLTHEIRVTVTRNAIPRRASTLASDVLRAHPQAPAGGGPADHWTPDPEAPGVTDDRTIVRSRPPIVAAPALPWLLAPFDERSVAERSGAVEPRSATAPPAAEEGTLPAAAPLASERSVAVAIHPAPDPMLAALGLATIAADAAASAAPGAWSTDDADRAAADPILPGLLAGDPAALSRLIEALAGADDTQRDSWAELLTRFVSAVRARALDLGVIDLPMGNRFWDTFTVDECREIVVALAATGRQFDDWDGWADGIVPTYRDLSRACADAGIDPRRVRAWPNSEELADLYRGASIAAGEAIARWAPNLDVTELRDFLAARDRDLDELWLVWDAVRLALGSSATAATGEAAAVPAA